MCGSHREALYQCQSTSCGGEEEIQGKIGLIGGFDPFLGPLGECGDTIEPVEIIDLVSILVLQISFVTPR